MKLTRRDLLAWSAGATAGLLATPVPWKVLDDVSIWTQNWPWIPQPARGPVEEKQSFCTLCPHGCGMRVRMAAGWPVGVSGMSRHPVSRGALCPLAFAAHQLNCHPKRLRTVRHRSTVSSWDEARSAFTKACSEGPIAIIDGYPGRASSSLLERFVQKHDGTYRVVFGQEIRSLGPYETWSGIPASSLGYDLEQAQTIVSFGAPLLDGWGTPGRFTRLWAERAAGLADPPLRLIHVEGSLSRTAARAWQWAAVRKGSEAALAAGLTLVLLTEHLVPATGPKPPLTLADVSKQTGTTAEAIRGLARTILARPPVLAIAADNNPQVAALNVVLGAPGSSVGIVKNSPRVRLYKSADAAPGSVRAVLIDSSVPWSFTPQTDAEVFRFAAWDGGTSRSDWLLPAPGFAEELTDVPTAPASPFETYAVSPSLVKSPLNVQSATQFLASIDPSIGTVEQVIRVRCRDLFRAHAGTVHAQGEISVAKLASADDLAQQLWKGAVWVGDPSRSPKFRCELKDWPAPAPAQAHARSWPSVCALPVLPPLASKLYQESNLREPPEGRSA